MPIYEYACQECGQQFDKRVSMSEAHVSQVCPQCNSQDTRKRLSTFAVGSGANGTQATSNPFGGFT